MLNTFDQAQLMLGQLVAVADANDRSYAKRGLVLVVTVKGVDYRIDATYQGTKDGTFLVRNRATGEKTTMIMADVLALLRSK